LLLPSSYRVAGVHGVTIRLNYRAVYRLEPAPLGSVIPARWLRVACLRPGTGLDVACRRRALEAAEKLVKDQVRLGTKLAARAGMLVFHMLAAIPREL